MISNDKSRRISYVQYIYFERAWLYFNDVTSKCHLGYRRSVTGLIRSNRREKKEKRKEKKKKETKPAGENRARS